MERLFCAHLCLYVQVCTCVCKQAHMCLPSAGPRGLRSILNSEPQIRSRYIKHSHASFLRLLPEKLGIMGHSMGGHGALVAALPSPQGARCRREHLLPKCSELCVKRVCDQGLVCRKCCRRLLANNGWKCKMISAEEEPRHVPVCFSLRTHLDAWLH